MTSSREEVFASINAERDYQRTKWNDNPHSNLEFLVYIRDYVEEAMHRCSRESDEMIADDVRHSLRKIATLAVAALEMNGTAFR